MTHKARGTYIDLAPWVRRVFIVTLENPSTREVTIDLIDPDSGVVVYSTPATRYAEGKHAYRRAVRWADYHGIPIAFSHLGDGEPIPGM